MKKLIIINGTMGVGKSTTCKELLKKLTPGVWLDGDWCWDMNPFVVNDENKAMVMGNITYQLRAFLNNSGYEYVIFCWVIHEQAILDEILEKLSGCEYELHAISLVCSPEALAKRMTKDIDKGVRPADTVIERSVERLELYDKLSTVKLDVSGTTAEEAAVLVEKLIRG